MNRFLIIMRKEFKQIFRTREMIMLILVAPVIQLMVMGFAVTNEVKHVQLIIVDNDRSEYSRELAQSFRYTDRFDVVGETTDLSFPKKVIHAWKAQAALIIPEHFSRDMQRHLEPSLQIIVDGLDSNTASVSMGYMQGILTLFAKTHPTGSMGSQFLPIHLVNMQERMRFNPNMVSSDYMIPGIISVLLTMISLMLSSMSLVREKEIGTLEQLLVTPLRKWELLLGKILPFLILGIADMVLALFVAQFVFGIHMQGSYIQLIFLAVIYLFTSLGLGILISTNTGTQQQAMFFSWFCMVFMILLSGLFVPIENMPLNMQRLTLINPMRYFIYIVRDIFEKGASIQYLWKEVLPMAGIGIAIFTSAILTFQKRIK